MYDRIYPCVKGWMQFYSTTPKHWCCVLEPPYYGVECKFADVFYGCVEVKVSDTISGTFNPLTLIKNNDKKFLVIVENEIDTPKEWEVDMQGYLKNPGEYMLKIKDKRYENTDKV